MGKIFVGLCPNFSEEVQSSLVKPMIDHRSEEFSTLFTRVMDRMKEAMQTKNDLVLLTCSGSGGVEAAVRNFIQPEDNVIIPCCGLFSNMLLSYVSIVGGNAIKIEAPLGDQPPLKQIEEAFEKTKNVKAFLTVYDETSTGVTFTWFKEAGELCKKYNSFFIVDAHSVIGASDFPLDDYGVDVCVATAQVGMGSPAGICFVCLSEKAKQYIYKNPPQSVYFDLSSYLDFFRHVGQTPFTTPVEVVVATDEALRIALEEGLKIRTKRISICADAFYAAFDAVGLKGMAKKELRSDITICYRYPEDIKERDFRRLLDNKYGMYVYFAIPGTPPQFRITPLVGDPALRESRVLGSIAAICSVINILGAKKVDMGKALEAAVLKLEKYPAYGTAQYPELDFSKVKPD